MSASTVRLMCPNLRCRAVLAVPAEARGRMVRCRNCGTSILVPQKQVPVKQEEPAEPAKKDPKQAA